MLSEKEFTSLNYTDKKWYIQDIFSQLSDKEDTFKETIFLLQASNKIQDSTLNKIYKEVTNLLQNKKETGRQEYLQKIESIKYKIEEDITSESKNADLLLSNI